MTQPAQYTEADVELVAQTFITEAKKNPVATTTPPWMGVQTRMLIGPTEHDIARAVLDALTAAGRLLPVDAETEWQYGIRSGDDAVALDGTPRIITRSMVRRQLLPIGPWENA